MKATKISLEAAKSDKLFYFVANVVVYRPEDQRCLLLKRSERETAHPGQYGMIGGKLEWNDLDISHPTRLNGEVIDFEDAVEDLLQREALEEAGVRLKTDTLLYLNSVAYIRPDGVPSILVKFVAEYAGGEVELEEGAFTDFAWVNEKEAERLDCIEGIKEEVRKATELSRGRF